MDATTAQKLIQHLTDEKLWSLNSDSLNMHVKLMPDGEEKRYLLNDGMNYKFELLSESNFLIIEAYEPDYFLKEIPEIKSRETFVKLRNWFLAQYQTH